MKRINCAWNGALIIFALIIVSVQCLCNQETYIEALLKCAQLKAMSERNVCRAEVTERYRRFSSIPSDEAPYFGRVKKVTLEEFSLEGTDER